MIHESLLVMGFPKLPWTPWRLEQIEEEGRIVWESK